MSRPLRPPRAGGVHHVVNRGVGGAPIVMDDFDRAAFVRLLGGVSARCRWRVHAYCLLTTHVHLVLETPEANLSRGLQRLTGQHAQAFNRRWGRFGHLFADRFWSRSIVTDDELAAVLRYVFDNPVAAGLCQHPSEWRWSGGSAFPAVSGAIVGV